LTLKVGVQFQNRYILEGNLLEINFAFFKYKLFWAGVNYKQYSLYGSTIQNGNSLEIRD